MAGSRWTIGQIMLVVAMVGCGLSLVQRFGIVPFVGPPLLLIWLGVAWVTYLAAVRWPTQALTCLTAASLAASFALAMSRGPLPRNEPPGVGFLIAVLGMILLTPLLVGWAGGWAWWQAHRGRGLRFGGILLAVALILIPWVVFIVRRPS